MPTNTIKVEDLARVQDIEFVNKFNGNAQKLLEVLGKTSATVLPAGSALKIYKTSGTLDTTQVGPGEEINISKYKNELAATIELSLKKYRKQASVEAIAQRGYAQAVTETDKEMIGNIQKAIRGDIFKFLATGTGTATGATFQKAVANTWAALEVAFEDDMATPVYFVNPADIAEYLGTANINQQNVFGMTYIENFLGMGTVIIASDVPAGKLYATAQENINVVSCNAGSIEGFNFYGDATGLIGVAHDTTYTNGALETVAVSGMTLFGEYLDRIIVATIGA